MKTITLTLFLLHLLSTSCTPQYTGYNYALGYQAVIAPADDTPDLKDCSPEAPCQYGEGDCTRHGDDGCDSDLVCGVNNCGDFVPGMAGSCCVQLAGPSISSYRGEEEPGEFKTFPVETVPGGWSRWTAWSQTLAGWGRERRRIATAGDGDLLAHLERQILD